ncbi:MAG: 1-acyl-sn-glycerol-3-phosphate acyltransferase [Rhodospirillaceae bacterium]|nr:1-acyl-sn-glycerol-3-phosphate acyltransferase [Rhodospirillaceae bacterium]
MIFLRSAVFNILFFAYGAFFSIILLPGLVLSRRFIARGFATWIDLLMATMKVVVGIEYEVRGKENLPLGAAVIASKHQSAWETGIYFSICPDAVYVLKKELQMIPIYGWLLKKSGMIPIDRDGGGAALKQMIRDCHHALGQDLQVVIFPEGTRAPVDGANPYHPGIAAVYKQIDAPVVPVALNSGVFWPRRQFLKKPGRIVIEFLDPMPQGLDRKAFMAELESRIETATQRLVAEARQSPS